MAIRRPREVLAGQGVFGVADYSLTSEPVGGAYPRRAALPYEVAAGVEGAGAAVPDAAGAAAAPGAPARFAFRSEEWP